MFSPKMASIRPFYVMQLLERARALESEGKDIVHMEIGEPDFVTPPCVVEAAEKFIRTGDVKYTPSAGLPALREAIAGFYRNRYGVTIATERVFVTPGASGAFLLALGALLEAGDQVLLADPGYPCYANFVRLFSGDPVGIPVDIAADFQMHPDFVDQYWAPRTRGVVLASPSNPTGTQIRADLLGELIRRVLARGGCFISDEIYHGLEYGVRAHSALEFSDQVLVINSFSKYFGMTGWRLGWLIAPDAWVSTLEKLAQNIFISAPAHSQVAAVAAFGSANIDELESRRREFQKRRDYLLSALLDLGFEVPVRPEGAFYIYADSTAFAENSFKLAWNILEQAGVAVTPGRDFGENAAERYLRFSYTTSLARLVVGIDRLSNFLVS